MIHRYRRTGAAFLAAGCLCLVTACGSSSNSGSGSRAGSPSSAPSAARFTLTATQRSCLKAKGVLIPTGFGKRPGGGTAPTGRPSRGGFPGTGTHGMPPKGARRKGFHRSAERTAAFKACGVSFPAGGPRGGAPATSTTG
jgi:hypothetical protein